MGRWYFLGAMKSWGPAHWDLVTGGSQTPGPWAGLSRPCSGGKSRELGAAGRVRWCLWVPTCTPGPDHVLPADVLAAADLFPVTPLPGCLLWGGVWASAFLDRDVMSLCSPPSTLQCHLVTHLPSLFLDQKLLLGATSPAHVRAHVDNGTEREESGQEGNLRTTL